MSRGLSLLALVACAHHPPVGDPALQQALTLKALEQSAAVGDCLRKDGIRANLAAEVRAHAGEVVAAEVTTLSGETNPATECLQTAISHWRLAETLSGEASLLLADDSAEQDARTARAEVDKTVRAHQTGLLACHRLATDRADGQPPTGLIVLTWTLDGRSTHDVAVATNDTGDAPLADCLVDEVESWSFPPHAFGPVTYPFEFTAEGLAP